jgi:hypothetical protein
MVLLSFSANFRQFRLPKLTGQIKYNINFVEVIGRCQALIYLIKFCYIKINKMVFTIEVF